GGSTPSIVAIAVALVVSTGFGMLIVGPRLSRRRTAAGVAADQLVFHGLFAFFGTATPVSTLEATHGAGVHAHVGAITLPGDAATSTATPVVVMIAAHLAAAMVSYALIRGGVSAVSACVAALLQILVRAVRVPLAPVAARVGRLVARGQHPAALRGTDAVRIPDRRGPPEWAVA
ncbi:MAG: hypothetical protein RL499_1545, partial [Actinomycetota bacterium]